jgi:hypothetical protein
VSGYYALASSPGSCSSAATRTCADLAWACPGGFAAVSRSLLMLTPGDDTSPLKQQQHDCNSELHNEIVETSSTYVLESDRTQAR